MEPSIESSADLLLEPTFVYIIREETDPSSGSGNCKSQ